MAARCYFCREVARRLDVSHSVIQRLFERFLATGSTAPRPRSGRPRATDRHDDNFLRLTALRRRSITAEALRQQLRDATHVTVCQQTIRNRLREAGLTSRQSAVCIPLTAVHRQARLAWCQRYQRWTRQEWSRVLFSDESRYNLSHSDGRIRVWRRPGERFADVCIQERDRYGGGSLMVWGGIHTRGRTPLYLVQGMLTGVRYRDGIIRAPCATCSTGHWR